MANGPLKTMNLAKLLLNFAGLADCFLVVMFVSQSQFFDKGVSSLNFFKAKRVVRYQYIFFFITLNDIWMSWNLGVPSLHLKHSEVSVLQRKEKCMSRLSQSRTFAIHHPYNLVDRGVVSDLSKIKTMIQRGLKHGPLNLESRTLIIIPHMMSTG